MLLAGCEGDLSTLAPAGPVAQGMANLWWAMFWGALAIFLFMMALFLLLMFRPDMGRNTPAYRWIIWGGLVFPVPVLLLVTGVALWQGERALGGTAPDRIEAEAQMWFWRFSYPGTGMPDSIDVMHMPAGRDVEIVVTSPDVIHSFWIPRLGGKIDAIPGHANTIVLHADEPGEFGGVCAEYCGIGHIDMSFTAVAHADWPAEAQ
ncbi:cytochrome c oxidase subunit II [Falsirhodobacter deserti]|uniref:cytochrome c oxidase subunit II n=1 Tax=Falsirhodobacter deserti TaxID=1365611 RepID=UPI000FE4242F|nr:cytochrome c oxidase subunit II [Falsirhodobacter deserti]